MSYHPPHEFRRGRWVGSAQRGNLNLPRLSLWTEGTPGEFDFYCELTFTFGNEGSDPVLMLSVDLADKWLGRKLSDLHWRWEKSRGR